MSVGNDKQFTGESGQNQTTRDVVERPEDELFRVGRTLQKEKDCRTPSVNLSAEITPIMGWVPGDRVELSVRTDPIRVVIVPEVDNE